MMKGSREGGKMQKKKELMPSADSATEELFDRVAQIIESARSSVVHTVNQELVQAYWAIGREIVLELQEGEARAVYGKQVIRRLSEQLTERFRKGFSELNLQLFRRFYLAYSGTDQISYTACKKLKIKPETENGPRTQSRFQFHPKLSWSHYRILMRVEKLEARAFYEKEAGENGWSVRQLERQVGSLFYERLLKSRDKTGMLTEANSEANQTQVVDVIKDPYMLEFLDLPESPRLQESDLESALIGALQEFLLELGSGFAFIGRQKRITLDGDHFFPDLVFYHIRLRCYVIIDLKTRKLTHGDIGQMQMYVGYYDQEVRRGDENATIGLILCSHKNDAVVKYVLGEQTEHIFASRYKLELPDEETLRKELARERELLENKRI